MYENQSEPATILLVGIGGYGHYYLKTILEEFPNGSIELRGVVDPYAGHSDSLSELKNREIPIFSKIEDFYEKGFTAGLAVIATPLHFHIPQSIEALEHGSNVLCEKPISAMVQEVDQLIKARDTAGKWVMIGYQWCFSQAIQALKRDILKGLFGKPQRLKTLCFWPRDDTYYQRNDWAGKLRDSEGRWILDSPANNALAHFLHNLFYVLGEDIYLSVEPEEVEAEVYRANPIENFDTVACRIFTKEGTELLFYGSHASLAEKGPMFNFKFEKAVISYGETSEEIIATDTKGNKRSYGSPDDDHQFRKLFEAVEAVKRSKPILCGPEAARAHTLCINGIRESVRTIPDFPKSMIQRDDKKRKWWVKGLDGALYDCYQQSILPHEAGFSWAVKELNRIKVNL